MLTARNPCAISLYLTVLSLLAGCSLQPAPPLTPLQQCERSLQSLQQLIADAGTGDAQYHAVADFPTYRSNRFLASFANEDLSAEQQTEWRTHLHQLGLSSLHIEWQNLPIDARRNWQEQGGYPGFNIFAERCDDLLWQASLQRPVNADAVQVPDSYNTWQRVLGLYSVLRYGAEGSIHDYQQDMRARMNAPASIAADATILYTPATIDPDLPVPDQPRWPAATSALGIPQLSIPDLQALWAFHAPQIQVEQRTSADLIGAAAWHDQTRTLLDAKPVLYGSVSYLRSRQDVLLQLNYTLWFAERPKPDATDWYGGKLDGLVWRVTLNPDGSVLFYDSIHPCGCYHSLHIPQGSPLQIGSSENEPLLAFAAPFGTHQPNPVLLLQADTHYLVGVQAMPTGFRQQRVYGLEPYDQLRSLPAGDHNRSWFDSDGLIAESARFERYFLWPLGVPSAGAMRQQGHHAIAFIGRRHFDEAWLEDLTGTTRAK